MRLLGGSVVKNPPAVQETRVQFLVRKTPWRREWQPIPVFLLGKSQDGGSSWATIHGAAKESDTT